MADISRIGVAQDQLLAILQARAGLAAIPLELGFPREIQAPAHIWIHGSVENWEQEWEVTGDPVTADREERFRIPVSVMVSKQETFKEARDKALLYIAEIERAVRAKDDLNDSVFEVELLPGRFEEGWGPDDRQALATVFVPVRAFLGT